MKLEFLRIYSMKLYLWAQLKQKCALDFRQEIPGVHNQPIDQPIKQIMVGIFWSYENSNNLISVAIKN